MPLNYINKGFSYEMTAFTRVIQLKFKSQLFGLHVFFAFFPEENF